MKGMIISDKDREKAQGVELRSEQLRDILGQVPRWIVRYGTVLIFLIILVLFIGSALLRYPDVIAARLVLTTETPPVQLIAKKTSKICSLLVDDKSPVAEGQLLAVLTSSADYRDALNLRKLLGERFIYDSLIVTNFPDKLKLGMMQESYAGFQKRRQENLSFIEQDNYRRMIRFYEGNLGKYSRLVGDKKAEAEAAGQVYGLARKKYMRDSTLMVQSPRSIAPAEVERSEQEMLETLRAWRSARAQLSTADIELSNLQQQMLSKQLEYEEAVSRQQQALQEAYEALIGQLADWEDLYILRAPFSGKASFIRIWSESQNVQQGDVVLTILPLEEGNILGKAMLDMEGIGKIKADQKAIIRFANYPYMEFGTLSGTVTSISLVPVEGSYMAEIRLDSNRLITNYGKELEFQQNMQGIAEIITGDRSLLQRITDPFRSAFRRQRMLDE
ncbi:MAG: HlyD family efflux transporter periplasmic adaptor subunit [Bacteroidales bacterium]|nr:HlyD family efflux transporter periplasmic adaptor subunit [Bacteroidales bacterium]